MKAVLIDDEQNALELLDWQLRKFFPEMEISALCSSADEGIAAIRKHAPELVFLDIEMPVKNGFEVLHAFDQPAFSVIFTTAYDQFAIQAIKHAAFDYLLKPVEMKDLQETVGRYMQRQSTVSREQVAAILNHQRQLAARDRIALTGADGMLMVKPADILYCQSSGNYTRIFFNDGRDHLITRMLGDVEEVLSGHGFFRIHNSSLINLSQVLRYVRTDGFHVVMSNGSELPVSRTRKDDFLKQFAKL